MIIPEDGKDSAVPSGPSPVDGPPPYGEIPSQLPSTPAPFAPRIPYRPRPADVPATNYARIKRRNSSVKGTYVIDAGLYVPHDILMAAIEDERWWKDTASGENGRSSKNICLESQNGGVEADVWLVDDGESGGPRDPRMEGKRAELEFKSQNWSVNVKLDTATGRPYILTATSQNGPVCVAIPPDFVGPVTLTAVNFYVSLPGSMKSRLVIFSEDKGTRYGFIGDYREAGYTGRQNWTGSAIEVGSYNSKVTLLFIDEEKQYLGFWHKLSGGWI